MLGPSKLLFVLILCPNVSEDRELTQLSIGSMTGVVMSTLRVLENQTWISEMKLMIAIGLMLSFRTVSPADPIEAGFVLNGGSFNWFTHPGATTGTVAGGINDAGQIAGYY